jgi:(p)ppGpp synthase/HD superfamily hydrolase
MGEFNELTDLFTSDLVKRALRFAAKAHAAQVRKYTGEAYLTHLVTVAGFVAGVGGTKEMVAAALLHDVLEDQLGTIVDGEPVSLELLKKLFGNHVADLVFWLTDISIGHPGNRAARKALDRVHIAAAPAEAKTIKLGDLIDNTGSITKYDPDFAKVYMREKDALLQVLTHGDPRLHTRAVQLVSTYFQENPE